VAQYLRREHPKALCGSADGSVVDFRPLKQSIFICESDIGAAHKFYSHPETVIVDDHDDGYRAARYCRACACRLQALLQYPFVTLKSTHFF
jgi:hypothetical protein